MQLQSILNTIPKAMVIIDEPGIISSFSATAQRLFGYTDAVSIGHNVIILRLAPTARRMLKETELSHQRL